MNKKNILLTGIIATIFIGCILQHFFCCCEPSPEPDGRPKGTTQVMEGEVLLQDGVSTGISESVDDSAESFISQYNQNPLTISFGLGQMQPFPSTSESVLLKELCEFLITNPDVSITVNGYGDSTGTVAGNLAVTRRRAENVKRLFVAEGISQDRISAIGKGAENPVGDNSTPEGRALNRRVEVFVD